ncbi:MAG: LamG domain-containing protein [Patulibacter minatonensis]
MPPYRALACAAFAAAALIAPAAAAAAEPNLVARWSFDTVTSNSTPVSGGLSPAYDGSVVGATVTAGRFANGLAIVGGGGTGVSIADPSPYPLETGSVTVLQWVKASTTPAAGTVLSLNGASTYGDLSLRCKYSGWTLNAAGNGGPQFAVGTGDGTQAGHVTTTTGALNPGSVWDGQWHAIAGTFDAATKKLSIALDGTVVSTATAPSGAIDWPLYRNNDYPGVRVGHYPNTDNCGTSKSFTGSVDELRIYDRALTASELGYLQSPQANTPRELPAPATATATPTPTPTATATPTPTPTATATPTPTPTPTATPTAIPTPAPTPPRTAIALPTPIAAASLAGDLLNDSALATLLRGDQLDALVVQIARIMQANMVEQRKEAVQDRITAREEQMKTLKAQSAKLEEAARDMQLQTQITASSGISGGYAIVGGAVSLTSTAGASKLKTTQVIAPPVVVPVKDGKITAPVPSGPKMSAAFEAAIAGTGRLASIDVAVKAAVLPADAFGPADLLRMQAQADAMSEVQRTVSEVLSKIRELADGQHSSMAALGRLGHVPLPELALAKPSPRQLASKITKLRKKLRDQQKRRDALSRKLVEVARPTFVKAGAADAPIVAYAVKGCRKGRCPFTP